jgi:hypothetical protein
MKRVVFLYGINSVAEPGARGAVITDYGSGLLTFYQILRKKVFFAEECENR